MFNIECLKGLHGRQINQTSYGSVKVVQGQLLTSQALPWQNNLSAPISAKLILLAAVKDVLLISNSRSKFGTVLKRQYFQYVYSVLCTMQQCTKCTLF